MKTELKITEVKEEIALAIYGIDEMIDSVKQTKLHSLGIKVVADFGDLCDADCIDCD
jgi:hypothetical protein